VRMDIDDPLRQKALELLPIEPPIHIFDFKESRHTAYFPASSNNRRRRMNLSTTAGSRHSANLQRIVLWPA
jgi:hypothetical protein